MTARKGGSHISAAVLACETSSDQARVEEARAAAEREAAAHQAAQNWRQRSWLLPARRRRTPYVPSAFPVEYGNRSYSPVSKYADGIRAGDYITYFDAAKAARKHRDPCATNYDHRYEETIFRYSAPAGVNVGYVVATFQHFGRDGAPVQIALHTGVVLDKRPSDKLWVEETSGRGCEFDGDCEGGFALVDLISSLMEQDTGCHYRRLAVDFAQRLTSAGHAAGMAMLAWDAAIRWGLMVDGRISAAGRTWWYAERRNQGIEILEGAMAIEPPVGGQVIHISGSTVNGSSFAAGPNAQATTTIATPDSISDIVSQVIEIVKAGRQSLDLSVEKSRELDDSLEVLEESATSPEPRGASFRMAVRSVLNLAGALVVGAAGNGVWEAFKALAN